MNTQLKRDWTAENKIFRKKAIRLIDIKLSDFNLIKEGKEDYIHFDGFYEERTILSEYRNVKQFYRYTNDNYTAIHFKKYECKTNYWIIKDNNTNKIVYHYWSRKAKHNYTKLVWDETILTFLSKNNYREVLETMRKGIKVYSSDY